MAFEKILVLDDEMIIRKTLEQQLRKRHYNVATASTLAEAEEYLARDVFDLMFVDVRLPDGEGTQLLERFQEDPNAPLCVVITGFGTIESAVGCMKRGAFDYIVKPCSIEEIDVVLKKAEDYSQLVKVNRYLSGESSRKTEIIGKSGSIKRLRTLIRKVSATEATVLITGENGTGKELVAGETFRLSPLSGKPYIRVNCAAIAENLIESEFFGHEKGAFTGATQRREGRFELANNGTILLDEIAEIPPRLQAKLLRVLQEGEFERVGGNRTMRTNARVLATTNRDLAKAVERGEFREDLYYRLNVFPIVVPALRERREDIPLLAEAFLERLARKHGLKNASFSAEAVEAMLHHSWPGNVRELQNTIERAVILVDEDKAISPLELGLFNGPSTRTVVFQSASQESTPSPINGHGNGHPRIDEISPPVVSEDGDSFPTLEELEKRHILTALDQTSGRRNEAADMLKISARTLRNKIAQYRLEGEEIP